MKKVRISIDAVEMTRQIRDAIYEETRELESEALLRYFHERSQSVVENSKRAQESEPRNESTIR